MARQDPNWSYGKSVLFISANPFVVPRWSYGENIIVHDPSIPTYDIPELVLSKDGGISEIAFSKDNGISEIVISKDQKRPEIAEAITIPVPEIVKGENV